MEITKIRDLIKFRRYHISEHIIRFLMGGFITLSEIENVINTGELIENPLLTNRFGNIFIQGSLKDKTLCIEISRGPENALVIALVYLKPYPSWPQLLSAQSTMEHQKDTFPNCFFCGGKVKSITVGNFDYRLDGALYVIKDTPAGLCIKCGEKYVSADTAHRINALIESGRFQGMEQVRVMTYLKDI